MDYKSYALLAQWLNGMSFAVNSYLIPIQLCGGKKTKCHRYKCIYGISVFLPRFNTYSRYCYYRIREFFGIISTCYSFVAINHNTLQIRAIKKESLGLFLLKSLMFFEECFFFRSGSSSKYTIAMRIASESFNDFTVHEFVLLTTLKPWFIKPFCRPIMHG